MQTKRKRVVDNLSKINKFPKPIWNPKDIFNSAESFYKSANIIALEFSKTSDFSLISPILTIDSLAIELYFKSIYILENSKNSNEQHNLLRLFNSLSANTKTKINECYNQFMSVDKQLIFLSKELKGAPFNLDIVSVLSEISNAFIEWRYIYEGNTKGFPSGQAIIKASRFYLQNIKPEWFTSYPK